ncbi:uncharacterized protein LOC142178251 [Nicotiana tabacum]|uniref:Uncharacterized protein LOC142178251 n=1 Tax=Nicotiana tabacum TaxID=4097 RepID=A0AC58U2G9_TOBAC
MKLNPEKYAFGVASGKFLGFLVSNRGIKVNPAQIKALKKYLIYSQEKKGYKDWQFEWTEECRQALKDLKAYITNPPLLSKPRDGESLFVYLAVAEVAVNAVLVREDKELSDKLAKWAIELSEYDIIYQPRTVIKSQVLADFVADFNIKIIPKVEKELQFFTGANPGTWTLFTGGSSNVKGVGLGIGLIPPSGESIRQAIKYYPITNNEAEYEAVIAGLELARELSIEQIMIKSDSQLVVSQMQGTYTAREARMQQYLEKA